MKFSGLLIRYAVIGVGVAAIYVLIYLGLLALDVARMQANAIAFSIAIASQYVGQSCFTYRRSLTDSEQIIRFGIMIGAGFVSSALITSVIAPQLGMADMASAIFVTVVLPVQNFVFMTLWVFSNQHTGRGRSS